MGNLPVYSTSDAPGKPTPQLVTQGMVTTCGAVTCPYATLNQST